MRRHANEGGYDAIRRYAKSRDKARGPAASEAYGHFAQTNSDTAAICDYMTSNNIEMFTGAFLVTNPDAKALLEGCATDREHYYDASDPEKLLLVFSGIADSLRLVRLAR